MSAQWIDEPFGSLCPLFVHFSPLPSPSVDPRFPGQDPAPRHWISLGGCRRGLKLDSIFQAWELLQGLRRLMVVAVGVLCKQNENTALDPVAAAEASPSGPGGE